ncbi:hypothetical protein NBRC116590_02970 [Pelagimonas sp. KU-00592-HH]
MKVRHEVVAVVSGGTGRVKHIVRAESRDAAKARVILAYSDRHVEFLSVNRATAEVEGGQ